MNRLLLLPLIAVTFAMHNPTPIPMADKVWVVDRAPLSSYSLSERRDSVALREARRFGVPRIVVYAVTHSEVFSGDSTAVSSAGAVGIFQIMPANHGAYQEECYGDRHITDMARNACIGINLLREYREQEGSWSAALKRYVGFKRNIQAWMDYSDDIIDHMVDLD